MATTGTRHTLTRSAGKFNRRRRASLGSAAAVLHLGVGDGQLVTDRLQLCSLTPYPWLDTTVPAVGAPLMVATTGVSSGRPAVTSVRPLSVSPVLMASRVMRLSAMVSTKHRHPNRKPRRVR